MNPHPLPLDSSLFFICSYHFHSLHTSNPSFTFFINNLSRIIKFTSIMTFLFCFYHQSRPLLYGFLVFINHDLPFVADTLCNNAPYRFCMLFSKGTIKFFNAGIGLNSSKISCYFLSLIVAKKYLKSSRHVRPSPFLSISLIKHPISSTDISTPSLYIKLLQLSPVTNPSPFANKLKTGTGLKSYELIRVAFIYFSVPFYFMISTNNFDMSHSIFYGIFSFGRGT